MCQTDRRKLGGRSPVLAYISTYLVKSLCLSIPLFFIFWSKFRGNARRAFESWLDTDTCPEGTMYVLQEWGNPHRTMLKLSFYVSALVR